MIANRVTGRTRAIGAATCASPVTPAIRVRLAARVNDEMNLHAEKRPTAARNYS